ncbi:hypothetical protein VNO77_10085 [Canavalia gladiata]|uniref:Uncharacterized protein n=1 Tax=Canavalia gladiata TaxID=3824 RepID=A0AAN9M9Z7_CANGL
MCIFLECKLLSSVKTSVTMDDRCSNYSKMKPQQKSNYMLRVEDVQRASLMKNDFKNIFLGNPPLCPGSSFGEPMCLVSEQLLQLKSNPFFSKTHHQDLGFSKLRYGYALTTKAPFSHPQVKLMDKIRGPGEVINLVVCVDVVILYSANVDKDQFVKMGKSCCKATTACSQLVYVYKEGKQKIILYVTAFMHFQKYVLNLVLLLAKMVKALGIEKRMSNRGCRGQERKTNLIVMGEKEVSILDRIGCDNKSDADSIMYPVYFGVSCAFFALQVLSEPHVEVEKWSKIRDTMLQGSAQLLGLIVWKVQKEMPNEGDSRLRSAEREIENLKRIRHEDAKANEKVVGIFAAQEQSWLNERRKLRQQIGALLNELRVFEKNKDAAISELNQKLKEMEALVELRDKEIEQEGQKRKELEEKLNKAERDAEELRESARREAQEHSSDLRKHKTAFIELVSNQRQLEAELGRAVKQVEATKHELVSVMEKKEESDLMAQKLSVEIAKFHKDLEQKDKILSAMLRKSKLDTAEKQMLLKEVKLSKARRKHAEQETEKWKAVSEGKHDRHSLKSMLVNLSSRMDVFPGGRGMQPSSTGSSHIANEPDQFSPFSDHFLQQRNEDLSIPANAKRLEDWMRAEAERYATLIEQRHHLELDAFAEQMRLKDEKLEAFRWQLLRTELETKQLQSHMEGLVKDVTQLRHDKMRLKTLLLEREDELTSLKEQFATKLRPLTCFRNNSNLPPQSSEVAQDAVWSRVKVVKRKPGEKEHEMMETLVEEDCEKEVQCLPHDQFNNANLQVQSPENEIEEEKNVAREDSPTPMQNQSPNQVEVEAVEKMASSSQPFSKTKQSSWKMDLHALGVSYKIKRLKQQLILVERLTGSQANDEQVEITEDAKVGLKAYLSLTSLLNKQLGRYQSLQEKTDDLCKRMHGNDLYANRGDMNAARTKEKTSTLEHFLEETFQLQRYIVATGQKLMEIQSKIVSGFVGVAEEMQKSAGIDMKRFADSIRNLFQEVQRGLEVRTARIIGDLEGTLAREGMICLRR